MINLTRRNFIKNVGFVGTTTLLCGSSLLAQNSFSAFSDLKNGDENILLHFDKLNYSEVFISDRKLLECYKKTIENWIKMGYQSSGNFCYSAPDSQLKMFPIHLQLNGSEKLDAVLLCFGKNASGEWKVLKSLTGFDLEAITVAMRALKTKNNMVDLKHYLFPAPEQQSKPYSYQTNKGTVYLKTTLSSGHSSTKIVVTEGSSIVYNKEIQSKHSLFVNSVLV